MPALSKALSQQHDPLPTPWLGGILRRGILAELGAAPAVGKSFVALRWALHLAERGYPVLYSSTDTTLRDQGVRLYSLAFGTSVAGVEDKGPYTTASGEHAGPEPAPFTPAARWLARHELPIRWSDLSIGTVDLDALIRAETMYFGQTPALVVVDVLGDLVHGGEDVSKVRQVVSDLKTLSREYNTCILALHHLRDGYANDGDKPVRLTDFRYEKGGFAEVMLGLWRPGVGRLSMRVLKNRSGEQGQTVELTFDPGRGHLEFSR